MPARHAKPRPAGRRAATVAGLTALLGGGMAVAADQASAAAPSISLDPSDALTLGDGGTLFVTATVDRDDPEAGDKVAFLLYGPTDPTCAGAPVNALDEVVLAAAPDPVAVVSVAVPPTAAGTYRWRVQYTDLTTVADSVTTPCSDAASTAVAKATPGFTTVPSPTVTLGAGTISDTVTVTGLQGAAGGTLGFKAYTNDTCTGTPALTIAPVPYAGGAVAAPATAPTAAGPYRWIATYGGDANNNAASSACSAANQTVVNKTAPTIATTAGADLNARTLTDTAVVTGRFNPQPDATVTFSAYGPDNETCAGAPAFTKTVPMPTGSNTVSSPGFPPTATGTYRWIASYSGDANNGAVTGLCSDPGETTIVSAVPVNPGPNDPDPNDPDPNDPDPNPDGLTCLGYEATIVRGNGDNTITGTNGRDVIVAGGGDDIVYGNGGDDVICGGDGDDAIDGGDGGDQIYGGDDNDTITGADGGDVLLGGADGDDLRGGAGNDAIAGNGGDDFLDGGSGTDECQGGAGSDVTTSCS